MMPLYSSLSDIDLVELLKTGDSYAFTEIFDRYWDKMYVHALKMLQNEEEAKDLLQEIFTSLWIKADKLELHTNLSGYLYVATRRKVLNYIRKSKTQTAFYDNLYAYAESNQQSAIDIINVKELAASLEFEIQNLPPKMRHVFEMSRISYLSHKEIAVKLNISNNTVKRQISNAIKIIRMKLENPVRLITILISLII
ncbi:MAG TPA: RNA polymerase sigma-70 factor [Sphingobacteriaceae bacterium]